jgi:L-lactate dehydrogenase complex protein LldG
VPDLPAALARLSPMHRAGRAYTVLVTGPSRTADIEKELVIPAHGPRELVVVLLAGEG